MQLEMLNAIQERKRCNRLVIIRWRNIILIGDHFGVDVKRNGDHFGVDLAIISGSGSFRGLYTTANFHVRSALMNKMVKCTNNETILPPNCKHIWLGSCVWFEDFKQRCQYCLIIAFIYTPLLLYHLPQAKQQYSDRDPHLNPCLLLMLWNSLRSPNVF